MMEPAIWKRACAWLYALVALGLALRLYHYGRNPALWHDEAATLLNVLRKDFGELLGPLYASATGPPLFLWVQKCALLAFGDGLYALRLFSLLASCAGLVLFARFAGRSLAPLGAAAAVMLVACSDRLLWHAAEARHYSSDFLLAVSLLALLGLTTSWSAARRAHLFALLAPMVIFASYPGVFLCGGVLGAIWPALRRERRWGAAILLGVVIALAFAAFYFVTIRAQRSGPMDAAWAHLFPDWQRPWTWPWWAAHSTVGVFDYIARPIGGVLLVAALIGSVRLWRTGPRELVLFAVTPMVLAMAAGLLKSYPYTGARTMVFAMPALLLLIGHGIDGVAAWRPRGRVFGSLALGVLIIPLAATLGFAIFRVVQPWSRAETDAASAYVLTHRQPNEPVTANHLEYEYYFRHLGPVFGPEMELPATNDAKRVWVVVTGRDRRLRDELVVAKFAQWRTISRREFARTSVLLVTQP